MCFSKLTGPEKHLGSPLGGRLPRLTPAYRVRISMSRPCNQPLTSVPGESTQARVTPARGKWRESSKQGRGRPGADRSQCSLGPLLEREGKGLREDPGAVTSIPKSRRQDQLPLCDPQTMCPMSKIGVTNSSWQYSGGTAEASPTHL